MLATSAAIGKMARTGRDIGERMVRYHTRIPHLVSRSLEIVDGYGSPSIV
jgi:repressor of nif and glnA expression